MDGFRRSPQFQAWLEAYDADHRHPWTHRTHALGIPMVILSVMGFVNLIPGHRVLWGVTLGWSELALATVIAFYAQHDLRIALAAAPAGAALAVLSRRIPWTGHAAIFVLSWVLQLLGHGVWERNRPAFFKSVVQLLVGPAYFLARLMGNLRAPLGQAQK